MHKIKAKGRYYYYAWRGGPRIEAEYGSKAFEREYKALLRERDQTSLQTITDLIKAYRLSPEWNRLRPVTRESYERHLVRILDEFGEYPLSQLSRRGVRGAFLQWRDEMASKTPRQADMTLQIFRIVLNFALDREYALVNPLLRLRPIAVSTRRDNIWSDDVIKRFMDKAPERMQRAMLLALWTGQRQSDLLALKWSAYDGGTIRLTQSKGGVEVSVPVSDELKRCLDNLARTSTHILTNKVGQPWRSGFRSSWYYVCQEAEITGLTFHDLRGTFVARAHAASASIAEIAHITGHTERKAETIIRKHYLPKSAAVEKIEFWRDVKNGVKLG